MTEEADRATRASEFGLIVYDGAFYENIGDEIQSLAAAQFLPRIDHVIPIDRVHEFEPHSGRKVKVILNGYFTCDPDAWPPSEFISPLFTSFHLAEIAYPWGPFKGPNAGRSAAEVLLRNDKLEYFQRFAPIGCRDLTTMSRFSAVGIRARFSGCLTLTLSSTLRTERREIAIVDVACDVEQLLRSFPDEKRDRLRFISHDLEKGREWTLASRFARAQELLWIYASCAYVVTSRLHCALPCLAFGTPVLFVLPEWDPARLPGLSELLNCVSKKQIEGGEIEIPWGAPPENPTRHWTVRENLIRECRGFVA